MSRSLTSLAGGVSLAVAMLAGGCTPNALADNRAMATAVLEKAGPNSRFTDASTDAFAAIRHVPSGMLCVLPKNGAFDFEAFPQSAVNEGAYCAAASNKVATTYLVVRFRAAPTLDKAFSDALAESAAPASPRPWSGQPSAADRASPEGLPHFRIARFEATIHGEPSYLRVAMSEAGGWYLQQVVSAPLDQAEAVEAASGESLRLALREFQRNSSPQSQ